jgi:solute carrier family 25 (mitochondrial carnitine/acylcarnitine transporter), member 20/29
MSEGPGAALDFVAGCVAGTLSILACHPLDTIRIRLQSGQFSSISQCFKSSLKNEGVLGLYKGLVPPLVGVSLINASLFGTKSLTHTMLDDMDDKSDTEPSSNATQQTQPNLKHLMISGAAAGFASGFLSSPIELLKIRQQLDQGGSNSVKLLPLTRDIVRNSGWLSLFRGLSATLIREIPSFPAYFVTYEYSKIYLQGLLPQDSAMSDAAAILGAGSLAGVSGWVFVYPIDVIKTKIQSEPSLIWKDRLSCVQMYRRLLKESGRSVFMRGFGATILRAVPTNAVIFGGYELTLEIWSKLAGSEKAQIG